MLVGLGVCTPLLKRDNFAVVSCLIRVTPVMTAFCLCAFRALHTIAVDAINIERSLDLELALHMCYAHSICVWTFLKYAASMH